MKKIAGMVIVRATVGDLPGARSDHLTYHFRPEHLRAIRPKLKQTVAEYLGST
ncbi:hypothetical protein [Bradyrhizobium sp. RT5a]|uniref:hypothetical protein n=1 Tax=unclassified Bradyrhizobium TaxID=2631580 RepID=UPI003397FE6C